MWVKIQNSWVTCSKTYSNTIGNDLNILDNEKQHNIDESFYVFFQFEELGTRLYRAKE